MLLLGRKLGEKFVIATSDGEVVVTVLEFRQGGRVALGIDAPKHVKVFRAEARAEFGPCAPPRPGGPGGPGAA